MASWKRPLGTTLMVEAIGLGGFFVAALISFSADKVVPALALRWELAEALAQFFRWLPGLQFLGLAVAIGSSGGNRRENEKDDEELLSRSIVPAALLAVVFSAVVILAQPSLSATRSSILAVSSTFNSSLEAARRNLESGDLTLARSELEVCEAISNDDPRVEEVEERLANAELRAGRKEELAQEEPPAVKPQGAPSARDYYLKALAFSEKGDWFSAHWYASTAARIDPSYLDAKRLAATSWEALLARGGSAADKETAAFYSKKLEGYGLLRSGDPVGAYGVFKGLSEKKPLDPDVKRYLAESLVETEKTAFFKDEFDRALKGGTIGNVFLRIPEKAGTLRFLAATSVSFAEEAAYFRELEYLVISDGAVSASVRAPYAKLAGGSLFLLCVDREAKGGTYRPKWSPGPEPRPASVVPLELSIDVAYRVLMARERPSALQVVPAWRAISEAPAYGIDPEPLERDLVGRTGAPFALFASGLIGALAGARFRRRGGRFPRGLYLLVPFMAAAGLPAFVMMERMDALLAEWTARAVPGLAAIWAAAGARTILLALAVVLVAGTRTDRSRSEES